VAKTKGKGPLSEPFIPTSITPPKDGKGSKKKGKKDKSGPRKPAA
jgi:hypothetical protein